MPQGKVAPARGILQDGTPTIREYEVKTVADMVPGRLVINDTNDYSIKVCTTGATTALGVLDCKSDDLVATAYEQYEQARVLTGDITVLMVKDSGCTCVPGTKMVPGDRGQVTVATTAGAVIGMAMQTGTVSREACLVKLLI